MNSRGARRLESERDQLEGPFTVLLRKLLSREQVLAAVLVDSDGEAVDYCTVLDPYEAKVGGAIAGLALMQVGRFAEATDIGRAGAYELLGTERDILARDLGEGYCLVVIIEASGADAPLAEAIDRLCVELREEAGLPRPDWDPTEPGLHVTTRAAIGWPYAPAALIEPGRGPILIADVVGRWEESGGLTGSPLTCFRVRLEDGSEVTLAYDEDQERWMRW